MDSNLRPADYKSAALPTELRQLKARKRDFTQYYPELSIQNDLNLQNDLPDQEGGDRDQTH